MSGCTAALPLTATVHLYLYATGGATLAAQKVKCDCGKERNLAGITTATKTGTFLSSSVAGTDEFLCQGPALER